MKKIKICKEYKVLCDIRDTYCGMTFIILLNDTAPRKTDLTLIQFIFVLNIPKKRYFQKRLYKVLRFYGFVFNSALSLEGKATNKRCLLK